MAAQHGRKYTGKKARRPSKKLPAASAEFSDAGEQERMEEELHKAEKAIKGQHEAILQQELKILREKLHFANAEISRARQENEETVHKKATGTS